MNVYKNSTCFSRWSVRKAELEIIIGISDTAIDNNIRYLKNNGYLERIGSNKDGYWKVVD